MLTKKDKWPSLCDNLKRQYIREGACVLLSDVNKKAASKEKGYVFVCNDIIIITLPAKGGYKTVDRVDMDQAILEDVADPDRTSSFSFDFLLVFF